MILLSLMACIDDDGVLFPGDLSGFVDLSVNAATASGAPLALRTEAGAAEVGGFNGTGQGNKAIAGVSGLDGTRLDGWRGLAMETTAVAGTSTPYFNVIVDLDCLGSRLSLVVADATAVLPAPQGDGSIRYAYAPDAAAWKAVGGLDTLLPSHLESTGGLLTDVVDAYPDACLRDADTGDGGMPSGVVTSAVMVILGDSVNVDENEHHVSAVEVGPIRYE